MIGHLCTVMILLLSVLDGPYPTMQRYTANLWTAHTSLTASFKGGVFATLLMPAVFLMTNGTGRCSGRDRAMCEHTVERDWHIYLTSHEPPTTIVFSMCFFFQAHTLTCLVNLHSFISVPKFKLGFRKEEEKKSIVTCTIFLLLSFQYETYILIACTV